MNDSQVVVKTRVRIDAPPRQMSLGDTIAVVLQDLEQRGEESEVMKLC